MQNKHSKFFYPSALEKEASRCKIYYLPLDYQPKPEPEPEQDWSERVLRVLERYEDYAIAVCGGLLAATIVRIIGQALWRW